MRLENIKFDSQREVDMGDDLIFREIVAKNECCGAQIGAQPRGCHEARAEAETDLEPTAAERIGGEKVLGLGCDAKATARGAQTQSTLTAKADAAAHLEIGTEQDAEAGLIGDIDFKLARHPDGRESGRRFVAAATDRDALGHRKAEAAGDTFLCHRDRSEDGDGRDAEQSGAKEGTHRELLEQAMCQHSQCLTLQKERASVFASATVGEPGGARVGAAVCERVDKSARSQPERNANAGYYGRGRSAKLVTKSRRTRATRVATRRVLPSRDTPRLSTFGPGVATTVDVWVATS